jgi:uncharacterized protein YjbI with pentapeptide repeats
MRRTTMSDDSRQGMQEQPHEPVPAVGEKWGDDITEERKAWLEARLQAWEQEADHGEKLGPFANSKLTGADVFWLAARTLAGSDDGLAVAVEMAGLLQARSNPWYLSSGDITALNLQGADLHEAHLEGASLAAVHLEGANLHEAYLEGADLSAAHLEGANLRVAQLKGNKLALVHLEEADLRGAYLEGATLHRAHLQGTDLSAAHLEGADLSGAHLEGAALIEAHLEGATLLWAHLEGGNRAQALVDRAQARLNLFQAVAERSDPGRAQLQAKRFAKGDRYLVHMSSQKSNVPTLLPPADLRLAFFDRATQLAGVTFGNADLGYVRVADTRWGEVNLAVVDWGDSPILQDERAAREWKPEESEVYGKQSSRQERRETRQKQSAERLDLYRATTRANRQLATVLRAQGLNDEADLFAYRAQLCQRNIYRLKRDFGRWFGSYLLDLTSGYGYVPGRSVLTYLTVVALFGMAYWALGVQTGHALAWNEAGVISLTAFHGRGFFPTAFQPGDPQAALAAIEAVIGLLIEITFIATFTQRFFAR